MDTQIEFNESFHFTKLVLFLSGIQVDKVVGSRLLNLFINWYFCLSQIWLYFDILGEIFYILALENGAQSFQEISPLIPCITISILGTIKAAPLYFQRDVLTNFIKALNEIHPSISDHVKVYKEQKIKQEAITNFKTALNLYIVMSITVTTPFCFLPLLLMVYDHYSLGATEVKFPFAVKYFFDINKPAVWPFIYIHQVISTAVVMFNILGADTLFYGACKFLQMHFGVLRCQLEALFDRQCNKSTRSAIVQDLREVVTRHQLLIELVKEMEKLFTLATLCNFVSSSFLICLCVFNITTLHGFRALLSFGAFLLLSLFQILMYCYGGDIVMQSSKDISVAAYNSLWYIADEDLKKSISIIHMRAQRACKLTAAHFADLNFGAFATVLRRSWSYLALLKTMYQ